MNLRRLALVASLASLAGLAVLRAQPAAAPLTIEEAVRRALDRNFSLEAGRLGPQIARDSLEIADAGFLPEFTVSASRGMVRTGQNGTTLGTKSETSEVRAGVSQRFQTGTVASVSGRLDRFERNPALATLNPAYEADVTVSLRQPLLAGAGLAVNRAGVERAQVGVARANLVFQSSALDVIERTEVAYYNLAAARELLEVRRLSLTLAQRLLDEARTRRQTGVATDLDVLQADVGVANARRGVLLAEQSVRDTEEVLLALIGQFELGSAVGAVNLPAGADSLPVFASSLDAAKRNQPDFLAARATLEQLRLDATVAKSGAKPDLSVGGAVGFNSFASTQGSDAVSGALSRDNHSWQVDVSLSVPWGQKAERARYRQARSAVTQQEIALRSLEQSIEGQVRAAVRAVETGAESVRISAQARGLAERQYELERARFDAGLSTSRRVLEAQTDLESARLAEVQSKVALRNAYAALHRIEGSAPVRYGVTLE